MSAADLLLHLRSTGFDLAAAGSKLLVTPASMLTDDLRASIRTLQRGLVALLVGDHLADHETFEERAAIMQFDGGLTRVDAEAAALALMADGRVSTRVSRACMGCKHFSRSRTCVEPVAAGLLTAAEGFGIVWPPDGHSANCTGFNPREVSR